MSTTPPPTDYSDIVRAFRGQFRVSAEEIHTHQCRLPKVVNCRTAIVAYLTAEYELSFYQACQVAGYSDRTDGLYERHERLMQTKYYPACYKRAAELLKQPGTAG